MQLQFVGPVAQFPLLGLLLALLVVGFVAFVGGGIFGPKLFQAIGMPWLTRGVQLVETAEQKLKSLTKKLIEQKAAGEVFGATPEQLDAKIKALIAEHFTSTT